MFTRQLVIFLCALLYTQADHNNNPARSSENNNESNVRNPRSGSSLWGMKSNNGYADSSYHSVPLSLLESNYELNSYSNNAQYQESAAALAANGLSDGYSAKASGLSGAQQYMANQLAANQLANHLAADQMVASHLAADHMAANQLTANQLAAHSLAANGLSAHAANQLAANQLAANGLSANMAVAHGLAGANGLAANALAANHLAENQYAANQMVANQLAANHLAASGLAAHQLAANQMASGQLMLNNELAGAYGNAAGLNANGLAGAYGGAAGLAGAVNLADAAALAGVYSGAAGGAYGNAGLSAGLGGSVGYAGMGANLGGAAAFANAMNARANAAYVAMQGGYFRPPSGHASAMSAEHSTNAANADSLASGSLAGNSASSSHSNSLYNAAGMSSSSAAANADASDDILSDHSALHGASGQASASPLLQYTKYLHIGGGVRPAVYYPSYPRIVAAHPPYLQPAYVYPYSRVKRPLLSINPSLSVTHSHGRLY